MRATAVVPVKRFGAAKSRLEGSPASAARPALAQAMLADVLRSLRRSELVAELIVVTGEPDARIAAEEAGATVIDDPDDRGHSEAAQRGVAGALADGAECVVLLPGDCPLMDPAELDEALGAVSAGTATVIPDRDGSGTNGLLLAPPDAIGPAFGPGSRERHLALARSAGVEARVAKVASLALDLDTADDLRELTRRLELEPSLAPTTAAALQSIGLDGGDASSGRPAITP